MSFHFAEVFEFFAEEVAFADGEGDGVYDDDAGLLGGLFGDPGDDVFHVGVEAVGGVDCFSEFVEPGGVLFDGGECFAGVVLYPVFVEVEGVSVFDGHGAVDPVGAVFFEHEDGAGDSAVVHFHDVFEDKPAFAGAGGSADDGDGAGE